MAEQATHPREVFDLKGHEAAEIAFEEARGNQLHAGRLRRELQELEETATRGTVD